MRGLEADARATLDRHLRPDSVRPIAVALSGGGDSLALTLIADRWASAVGRPMVILTVDHRLQAAGADWTTACARLAERLERPFHALAWEGQKPSTGLPAAARTARHRLLAEAAREAGARVILMGHTADDVLEARRMREGGATTPEPRAWAPSPVWPEGRGLFLLRPLLAARRIDLRGWLQVRGETWIDDPANADLRYARSRARAQADAAAPTPQDCSRPASAIANDWTEALGVVRWPRERLREASDADLARVISMSCVCAGGDARRPASAHIARIGGQLRATGDFVATLAGARVSADETDVLITREPGEAKRGGLGALDLEVGRTIVWDGRFEVTCERPTLTMRALAGLAARLPPEQRRRLTDHPACGRGGLPVVVDADGGVASPVLGETPGVTVTSLVGSRLAAAIGLVTREPL